jgi:methylenetetrahydrofolate dehydrogenase (NADP+)/methenyltetrahydrofolate cyclohydrolase
MNKMIDGKKLAENIQVEISKEIFQKGIRPSLAVVLVGDDPASRLYVNLKKKASQKVGIDFHEYLLVKKSTEQEVLETIDFLNKDKDIDAILIQLPLPKHFDTDKIIQAMDPAKDVDGFHPASIKKFLKGQSGFVPGLSLGIFKLIKSTEEELKGKNAVIVAKSDILYQPVAKLLNDQGVATAIVRPDDRNLKDETIKADILIVACGSPFFIKEDMVKQDSIVIDVGTNKIDNDYIVGDVDYTNVFQKAKFITPVPGGVGPMTVAMLLYNTLQLAENKKTAE